MMPQGHAVGQSPGQKSIPLKRLALDFHSSPTADDRGTSILDWSGFGKLLKLLDAVGLEDVFLGPHLVHGFRLKADLTPWDLRDRFREYCLLQNSMFEIPSADDPADSDDENTWTFAQKLAAWSLASGELTVRGPQHLLDLHGAKPLNPLLHGKVDDLMPVLRPAGSSTESVLDRPG